MCEFQVISTSVIGRLAVRMIQKEVVTFQYNFRRKFP